MAAPWEILESWRDALLGKSVARHHTAPNVRAAGIPGRSGFPPEHRGSNSSFARGNI